jgi:hypothetical protein
VIVRSDIWHWLPFVFLILFAAVEGLPSDLHEAARVDGRDALADRPADQISAAALRRSCSFPCSARSSRSRCSIEVFLLTSGGPGTSTELVNLHLVQSVLRARTAGYGALLSLAVIVGDRRVSVVARRVSTACGCDDDENRKSAPLPLQGNDADGSAADRRVRAVRGDRARSMWILTCVVQVSDRGLLGQFPFTPTLSNYADCCSAAGPILPQHRNSMLVAASSTIACSSGHRWRVIRCAAFVAGPRG